MNNIFTLFVIFSFFLKPSASSKTSDLYLNIDWPKFFETHETCWIYLGAPLRLTFPWLGHLLFLKLEPGRISSLITSEGRSVGKVYSLQKKSVKQTPGIFLGILITLRVVSITLLKGCHNRDAFPLWRMHIIFHMYRNSKVIILSLCMKAFLKWPSVTFTKENWNFLAYENGAEFFKVFTALKLKAKF